MEKLLVEICTKDRDEVLGRCMAALLNQSHQGFDVLVMNDGDVKVGSTPDTNVILGVLERHRKVDVIQGSRISQAVNHNIALYDYPCYKYILRLDDDILLDRDAIKFMLESIKATGAGAVGGLWFEKEWVTDETHDRATITWDLESTLETAGLIGDLNSKRK